jgi:hypothetical protein
MPRYWCVRDRTPREPVIARLVGLCLLVLAAWPASAEVRAEGLGTARLVATPAAAPDFDEREGRPPHAPTFAAGRADADEPEPIAGPDGRADLLPARSAPTSEPSRPLRAPLSHRACAAPPTGPPAA